MATLANAIACVKAGQLAELQQMLASDARLASEPDGDGMLLLHHACRRKQEAALEGLMGVFPAGALHADTKGWTPLHWAASRRASPSTLRCLLRHEPTAAATADKNGSLPLHVAVAAGSNSAESIEMLLDAHAAGAEVPDGEGRLPLHYAVSRRATLEVVAHLLRHHPHGVLCADGSTGELPAALASAHKASAEVVRALLAVEAHVTQQASPGTSRAKGGGGGLACGGEAWLDEMAFDPLRQLFHNDTLDAPNAWQVAFPATLTEEAAAIFEGAQLGEAFQRLWSGSAAQLRQRTGPAACFLATRVSRGGESGQWRSDITWISVDDPPTYRAFERLFVRSGLPHHFASIVPHDHTLRLYTAFYVVRTRCAGTHLHTDFGRAVGLSAMVMMTPLEDFEPDEGFHLLYEAGDPDAPPPGASAREQSAGKPDAPPPGASAQPEATARALRQYTYRKGTALVFSSRFRHSTQPGRACAARDHAGYQPQVYLCFVFGTDRSEHWPSIVQALEYLQSRMIARPDGTVIYNPGDDDDNEYDTCASCVGTTTSSIDGAAARAVAATVTVPPPGPAPSTVPRHRSPPLPPSHHNAELGAPNVWRFAVPCEVIDDAAALFRRCGLREAFESLKASSDRHQRLQCSGDRGERFFLLRCRPPAADSLADGGGGAGGAGGGGFYSDITWISVDDSPTHAVFDRLFRRLGVAEQCQRFVDCSSPGGRLTVYSAFFVVRTRCEAANFHVDYAREVGCNALTLMTPLDDFDGADAFQLLYRRGSAAGVTRGAAVGAASQREEPAAGAGCRGADGGDVGGTPASDTAQYAYRKGEAIVFGASFVHSTEPGTAGDPQKPHVYLCFTFGTDKPEHWPAIAQTIDGYQSRVLTRPDGSMVLSSWAGKQQSVAALTIT